MAFFHGDIYSYALDKMTPIQIYLPQDDTRRFSVDRPQKTLVLLHGLEGNYSYWSRYTSVERYAQERNLALIMPDADMSMYSDMRCGQKYASYIGSELPGLLKKMFRLNLKREDMCIAGLSMGGYGALRTAFSYPETFGRCASFSGALMLGSRSHLDELRKYQEPERKGKYIEEEEIAHSMYHGALGAYGEEMEYRPENDLLHLAGILAEDKERIPKVLLTCGSEDFLLNVNKIYSESLNKMGIENRLEMWSGTHNWQFWEESIRDYMDFFVTE